MPPTTPKGDEIGLMWRVSPDMMCVIDATGRFTAVNPAWDSTLGWTESDMVGQSYWSFLHSDDIARSAEAFEALVGGNPVLRFENRYRSKAGTYRWFSWNAVPDDALFFCTVRDVTDAKENEDIIAGHDQETRLREEFLAVLGHDLRNPVAAFGAGVRLMRRQSDSESATEILRQMAGSVVRMSELIENLMDFARVRLGGGLRLEAESTVSLASDLEQVVEEMRAIAPETEFVFDAALDCGVCCDVSRIKQVLSNLMGNALTHGAQSEPVLISARTDDGQLVISVTNGGAAVSPAAMERLFQPFYRGEVQRSQQGLGLGLYISKQIAQAHGGTIEVSSEPGRTSFTLVIPLVSAPGVPELS